MPRAFGTTAERGDLSDEEIHALMPQFADKANQYASTFYKKHRWLSIRRQLFTFEELEQVASVGAWRALMRYKHEEASPLGVWVCKGIWMRLRSFCHDRRTKWKNQVAINQQFPMNDAGEEMEFGDVERYDAEHHERIERGRQVIELARANLSPRELEIFELLHVQEMSKADVAKALNCSRENIRQHDGRILRRLRALLSPPKPGEGPKFCKTQRPGMLAPEWVEAAA